ncbi:MAG TPA: 3-isopropylmalate dehydrogenase [Terriglobales bacterium]|nr:3-isopropylmalate dehydrogenase [Terriglobales bacterium]
MSPSTKLKITILPGDGIGPEVTKEAVRILRCVADLNNYEFEFSERAIGGVAIDQFGTPLPKETIDACLQSNAVLLGAVGLPKYDHLPPEKRVEAGLLGLRKALKGFANLRPAVVYPAIADCSPLKEEIVRGADIMFVRELLGGLYFGEPRGFVGNNEAAFNTMRYSVEEIERVARVAFDLARKRRKKVTSVDKANVLETSQLWRKVVTLLAKDYPDIKLEHMYVDACAMRLVTAPTSFDVVLTENLFGDILSDEAGVLSGSLGTLASATIGGDVDLYEPVHGSAPDIAGKGIANPIGAIASAAMLLRHSARLEQDARDIEQAIVKVIDSGYRTKDLARPGKYEVTTSEMGKLVEQALAEVVDNRKAYHAV